MNLKRLIVGLALLASLVDFGVWVSPLSAHQTAIPALDVGGADSVNVSVAEVKSIVAEADVSVHAHVTAAYSASTAAYWAQWLSIILAGLGAVAAFASEPGKGIKDSHARRVRILIGVCATLSTFGGLASMKFDADSARQTLAAETLNSRLIASRKAILANQDDASTLDAVGELRATLIEFEDY